MINDWGIDLNKLSIVIGEPCGWEGAHGIYKKTKSGFIILQMGEITLMNFH